MMEFHKVADEIQSLVISAKNGVKLQDLQGDYRKALGRSIPFEAFGFKTLEEYIRVIPCYVRLIRKRGGDIFVEGIVNGSNSHMANLVAKQLTKQCHHRGTPRPKGTATPSKTKPSPSTSSTFAIAPPMTTSSCGNDQESNSRNQKADVGSKPSRRRGRRRTKNTAQKPTNSSLSSPSTSAKAPPMTRICGNEPKSIFPTKTAAVGSKDPMLEPSSWTVYRNPEVLQESFDEDCPNRYDDAVKKRQKIDVGGRFVPGLVGTPDNLFWVMPIKFVQGDIESSIENLTARISSTMNIKKPVESTQNRVTGSTSTQHNKRTLEKLRTRTCQAPVTKPSSSCPLPEKIQLTYGTFVPAPRLPMLNSGFDVTVIQAVDPDNMIVRECCQPDKLSKLETLMNMYYHDVNNIGPVDPNWKLVPGDFYALHHISAGNYWYRVCLDRIDSSNAKAIVCRIDHGDWLCIDLSQLQPLLADFCNLPSQAIRASLYGVVPATRSNIPNERPQWTQDGKEAFQKMVLNKNFFSIVGSSQLSNGTPKLSLTLVYTSTTARDTYIHLELIRLNIARPDF